MVNILLVFTINNDWKVLSIFPSLRECSSFDKKTTTINRFR